MATAANRLNIVILDACRDNPYGRSFRTTAARGLASVDAPSGTLIAYATSPGKVAHDGDGRNGLYTGELLKVLPTPGLRVEDVFIQVRSAVRRATNGDQVPWESSSLEGRFIFALPATGAEAPRVAVAAPPAPPAPPESPRFQVQKEIRQVFGTLAVSAPVAGVEVWLAGQRIGTIEPGARLVVNNVPAGRHRLIARKDGHHAWERDVEVAANHRAEVLIDIEPLRPESPRTAPGGRWETGRATSDASSSNGPAPVGSHPGGVSPYGVHDMAGSVAEWVADWYARDHYGRSSSRNPAGPDYGAQRVVRGGSAYSDPGAMRTAYRWRLYPDSRDPRIGFRCVRGLPP